MSIVSDVLVEGVYPLVPLPSIIGKEKIVPSVLYKYFWNVYFCLKICQYITSQFVEVTPPKALNVAS